MVRPQKEIMAVIGEKQELPFHMMSGKPHDVFVRPESIPITFYTASGKVLFYALVDVNDAYPDSLHVRLLVGHFGKYHRYVYAFFMGLAKHYGAKKVTFKTTRRFVAKYGQAFGFNLNQFGDYEKAVA